MYCTSCGAQNSDTAKFCRSCGKPLGRPGVPEGAAGQDGGVTGPQAGQPGAGTDPYGGWQQGQQAAQPGAGTDPYGGWQQGQQSGQPGAGTDPYGGWQQGQQAAQPGAGTDPYGGWQQGPQAGQPYGGYAPYGGGAYGQPGGSGKPKKKKKWIILVIVLVLVLAVAGGGIYLYVKGSDPMTPVTDFFDGFLNGNWEKVYDSIYWGEEGDPGYMSRSEFLRETEDSGSDLAGALTSLTGFTVDISMVSEGESYVGSDGLTRKNITVELSASIMGMSQSQEVDMAVVQSSRKWLFVPVWKIDSQAMEEMF